MRRLALICAFAATAHAEGARGYGGKIDAALLGAPATFDPQAAQTHAELTVAGLVFDTLYKTGANGSVEPHLAAGPPVVLAGAAKPVVRIPLRKGVKFSDGSALTAADIAASLERLRGGAQRWVLAPVAAIRAGSDELELELRVQVDVAPLLALPCTAITPSGKAPGARVVGSGPYTIDAIDRGAGRLVLRAYDNHFAGRPYLDQLVLHWYDKPEADARQYELDGAQISARGVAAFGGTPKYRAYDVESPKALLVFVGFGRAHASITGDLDVRRAIDRVLVRNALTTIHSGEKVIATREPVPVEAGGSALGSADGEGDVAAAQAALRGKQVTTPLEIAVEASRPDDRDIAERVARALAKLGITANVQVLAAPQFHDRVVRGTTDLWIGQIAAPATAPSMWWSAAFAAGGDDWAARALEHGNLDVGGARKAFAARLPIVPLTFRSVKLWYRTDVRGLAFDGLGRPCFAELFVSGKPKGRP